MVDKLTARVTKQQRDTLVDKLRQEPDFRELMKEDWKKAFKSAGIDPADCVGKLMKASDTVPYGGDPVKAGITVEIVISALASDEEAIDIKESVVFDQAKT